MTFRKSETIELKEIVVDEIKKRNHCFLLTVTEVNCISVFRTTVL